jgi:hypothetical protein
MEMRGKRVKALRKKFLASAYEGPQHAVGGHDGIKRPWRAFKREMGKAGRKR